MSRHQRTHMMISVAEAPRRVHHRSLRLPLCNLAGVG